TCRSGAPGRTCGAQFRSPTERYRGAAAMPAAHTPMAPSTTKKKAGATPARTTPAKPAKKPAAAKTARPAAPAVKASVKPAVKAASKRPAPASERTFVPQRPIARAMMAFDEDDVLPSGGSGVGM